MQEMPSLLDRRRLKDRIVESISKAVKQIQEYQFNAGVSDTVLTNHDWQFCRLVEHLDHAFLHGLRHITNGYWAVVQDFTHKAITKEVGRMTNVTTNLGRGRAWLYLALMDHLLESYMRCFLANLPVIKRYYAKEALVLDQQRMQIILTLAAGLEYITFQLDVDVPYLDLSSHMRPGQPTHEESFDRISLCSMDSSLSQSSSHPEFPSSFKDRGNMSTPDSDGTHSVCRSSAEDSPGGSFLYQNGFLHEDEENDDPQKKNQMMSSMSMPAMLHETEKSRMERVSKIPTSTSFDLDMSSSGFEVIHVKSKDHRSKKKKTFKKKLDGDSDSDISSINSGLSSSSDLKATNEQPDGSCPPEETDGSRQLELTDSSCPGEQTDGSCRTELMDGSCPSQCEGQEDRSLDMLLQRLQCGDFKHGPKESCITVDGKGLLTANIENSLDGTLCIKDHKVPEEVRDSEKLHLVDNCHINSKMYAVENTRTSIISEVVYTVEFQKDLPKPKMILHPPSYTDCDKLSDSGFQDNRLEELKEQETEEVCLSSSLPSVYDGVHEELSKEHTAVKEKTDPLQYPMEKVSDTLMTDDTSSSTELVEAEQQTVNRAEVKVDNNLLLLLMLHIFRDEEERLVKMYRTSVGHTEGDLRHVYSLITSTALYILSSGTAEVRFHKETIIDFTEIDYILLGLNEQMLTVICTNRRKQYLITTGEEELTRCIVGHLDKAIRDSERDLPRLSILTDPTTQRIALRKWAARESNMHVSEVSVMTYVLVHWEEVGTGTVWTARKEGTLLVRSQSSMLGTPSWKPNHFILKDGVLCQYGDRQDNSMPKFCIHLNEEECAGCRRSPQSDQQHCFELILADGTVLQMAAGTAAECQDWLMSLCQAVAEGSRSRSRAVGCLSCCAVVTGEKILMCHEDVQTNFFRTLGSADVLHVTSILTDSTIDTYLTLTFDTEKASVSGGYWTLYFNAARERDAFISSLSEAWSRHFQVSLPVSELQDSTILQRCREGQVQLSSMSV